MKFSKKNSICFVFLIIIFILLPFSNIFSNQQPTTNNQQPTTNNQQPTTNVENNIISKEINIDDSFKIFINAIIQKSLEQESEGNLSQGLLNCYEQCIIDEKCYSLPLIDLMEALPELIKELNIQLKAPRPTANLHDNLAGAPTCDLGQIVALIHQLQAQINQCCQQQLNCCTELISDFQQTWTILANIGTVTASIDLSPVFTALNACCTNINSEFQQTWSILGAGFNGTFSSIAAITSNNFSYSVITDLKATISTDFNQTWTILGAGFNGTFSAIAELDADLSGTFSAVAAGFNGTFSALNACCNNINSEFQQTWSILAAGFNGTFSVIEEINTDAAWNIQRSCRSQNNNH